MIKEGIWTGTMKCEFCEKDFKEKKIYGMTRPGCYAALCNKCADKYIIGFFSRTGEILKRNEKGLFEVIKGWR